MHLLSILYRPSARASTTQGHQGAGSYTLHSLPGHCAQTIANTSAIFLSQVPASHCSWSLPCFILSLSTVYVFFCSFLYILMFFICVSVLIPTDTRHYIYLYTKLHLFDWFVYICLGFRFPIMLLVVKSRVKSRGIITFLLLHFYFTHQLKDVYQITHATLCFLPSDSVSKRGVIRRLRMKTG